MNDKKDRNTEKAEIKKQNQDYPNLPASSEKIEGEKTLKKEVRETSKLQPDGKTHNNDKTSQ